MFYIFLVSNIVCPVVAEHLIAQHSAIKMLHSRVKIILEYVKAVEAGEKTPGHFNEVWKVKNVKISMENSCP